MGTSSTKRGRIDNSESNQWKNFKNCASRYFSGNSSFEVAMAKCVLAYGGSELFSISKQEKKKVIISSVFNFLQSSKNTGLKGAATSLGIKVDDQLSKDEILVLVADKITEDLNITGEDSFVREETLQILINFSPLFDEKGQFIENEEMVTATIEAMAMDDLVTDVFNSFVEACPFSTEKDNADLTKLKLDEARTKIKKMVKEEFNKGSFDANNYWASRKNIRDKVLNNFVIKGAKA